MHRSKIARIHWAGISAFYEKMLLCSLRENDRLPDVNTEERFASSCHVLFPKIWLLDRKLRLCLAARESF